MAKEEIFKADWDKDLLQIEKPFQEVPGINAPQINQDISIEV